MKKLTVLNRFIENRIIEASSFFRIIFIRRALAKETIVKEIGGSYAGHSLGFWWAYIQPIVLILVFMAIFGIVLGAKLDRTDEFPGDYTSYILSGLVPWFVTALALSKGPMALISKANVIKQVVFPAELLPFSAIVSSFIIYLPVYALLLIYKLCVAGGIPLTVLLLPCVMFTHIMLMLGITLFLSVLTPFVLEIKEFVNIYMVIGMYFAPAIYLPQWVPGPLLPLIYLNPFSYLVWVYQDIMFFGRIDHPFSWVVVGVMTLLCLFGGLHVFNRVRPYVGNVL